MSFRKDHEGRQVPTTTIGQSRVQLSCREMGMVRSESMFCCFVSFRIEPVRHRLITVKQLQIEARYPGIVADMANTAESAANPPIRVWNEGHANGSLAPDLLPPPSNSLQWRCRGVSNGSPGIRCVIRVRLVRTWRGAGLAPRKHVFGCG